MTHNVAYSNLTKEELCAIRLIRLIASPHRRVGKDVMKEIGIRTCSRLERKGYAKIHRYGYHITLLPITEDIH